MNLLRSVLILSFIFLQSCKSNDSLETLSASENNISNLSRIHYGMTEDEVEWIMHPPFKKKSFQLDNDIYEVWFYITNATVADQKKLIRNNLTPLIFKNDLYIAKGYNYYNWLLKQEEGNNSKTIPSIQKTEGPEDIQLEKALETPSNKTPLKQNLKKTTSMSSKPKKETQEEEPSNEKPGPTKEDDDFLDMEEEQNFDYW